MGAASVISGHGHEGVRIFGSITLVTFSSDNVVLGNRIGTDVNGAAADLLYTLYDANNLPLRAESFTWLRMRTTWWAETISCATIKNDTSSTAHTARLAGVRHT